MNLEKEFSVLGEVLKHAEGGYGIPDLVKIQQEIEKINKSVEIEATVSSIHWDNVKDLEKKLTKMTTLADDLSHLFNEMHSELANWDPKAGEEYERKFNEAMKR